MFKNRPKSHLILVSIFIVILASSIFFSIKIYFDIKEMSSIVSTNMKKTMDPNSPDPGKTIPGSITIPSTSKKVIIGTYLERIEELNIKESYWNYEFYLWFKWNPNELDFLGKNDTTHLKELPYAIINGDIIKSDLVDHFIDSANNQEYIQYFVKAKNTQFFDVTLYPIDRHDLIIPIEHKWLDRSKIYFQPDTIESKVSSRVMVSGYKNTNVIKLIEKAHAYKSAKGNPKFPERYKVDFSQYRMALNIHKGGASIIIKLFLILYVAVIVTFIAPFSSEPSRYTTGALFTTTGANYILASKLPVTNIYSLAEMINTFCVIIIIIMMALLAVLPPVIFKDGIKDAFEKRMNKLINISMFLFFLIVNIIIINVAINN